MLRPGWPEDAPELVHAISHEDVVARLARAPWPYALGDAQAFLAQPRGAHEPRFLIFDNIAAGPRLVGGIELVGGEELGYWLA
ncbi:GNAT family N-acetyltransferase, partial [Sphingomonas sp.]|uniref:GNAT family N-acetyltransferase n=1 Tax=Sphingomonas sp. TaxID=28214 RepID=UPI0035B31440